jgi:KDO2-lipid IV(A) lauroyltransferase
VTIDRRLLHPRYLHHWLLLGCLRLVVLLPLPALSGAGRLFGAALYWLAPFRRKVAETNIRMCFPELTPAQQRRLVKEACYSNAMGLLETAAGWWSSDARLRPHIEYIGFDKLHRLEGQGAILLGCHLTTLDFAGRMISMNADIDVVYRQQKYPVYDFVIRRSRERLFKHVIERSDTRQLVRCIRNGRTVWYAPDQDYGRKNAVFAPFFGVPAATLTATSRLAKMTGAPVYIYTHYRVGPGRYQAIIGGPIEGFPSGDDITDATLINQQIENAIRVHPEQYMWLHKRFKTRPEGKADFYPRRRGKRRRSRDINKTAQ